MSDGTRLVKGDLIHIITPGGGWGSPLGRPAESVLDDVLDGFVSAKSAFDDYGVVLDRDAVSLDLAATVRRRAEITEPTKMFHRGSYYDVVVP